MRTYSTRWPLLVSGAAALLVASTALAQDTGTAAGTAPDKTASAPSKTGKASASKINDAQIFAILGAANTGEINAANLAQTKTTNTDVGKFAAEMIKAHTAMNDDGNTLAKKLTIAPEENSISTQLTSSAGAEMTKLQGLSGAAFDKAYVDGQVTDHTNVLNTIDKTLMPKAKNPELKGMLKKARPIVAEHLKHAKHLQAMLRKGSKGEMGKNP